MKGEGPVPGASRGSGRCDRGPVAARMLLPLSIRGWLFAAIFAEVTLRTAFGAEMRLLLRRGLNRKWERDRVGERGR